MLLPPLSLLWWMVQSKDSVSSWAGLGIRARRGKMVFEIPSYPKRLQSMGGGEAADLHVSPREVVGAPSLLIAQGLPPLGPGELGFQPLHCSSPILLSCFPQLPLNDTRKKGCAGLGRGCVWSLALEMVG